MIATDFSLTDQDNKIRKLSDYKDKWVVLYFYPKDDTPGCTKEACSFRDSFNELEKKGAVILGVSKDSVTTHKKFADKYHLNFPILSDESHVVIEQYNAWGKKKFLGKEFEVILRMTYLIAPGGEIKKVYKNVNPIVHAGEVIKDFDEFSSLKS